MVLLLLKVLRTFRNPKNADAFWRRTQSFSSLQSEDFRHSSPQDSVEELRSSPVSSLKTFGILLLKIRSKNSVLLQSQV